MKSLTAAFLVILGCSKRCNGFGPSSPSSHGLLRPQGRLPPGHDLVLGAASNFKSEPDPTTNDGVFDREVVVPEVERREFMSQSVRNVAALASISTVVDATGSGVGTAMARAVEDLPVTTPTTTTNTKAIELPEIGLGAWAWGDSVFWGYNPSQDKDLNQVFDYAVDRAINDKKSSPGGGKLLLDSAELYGLGRSESLIGDFSKRLDPSVRDKIIVATKFAPLPFRTKPTDVLKACEASAKRLSVGLDGTSSTAIRPIDLYQIHFPMAYENEAVWDGLAMAYERGLVKAVGVSNYGVDAVRACHAALSKRGVPLATNQIQYSLVYRYAEDNGLLQASRDLDIQVLSYSPLALGLLTGKYIDTASVEQKVKGPRKALFRKSVELPEFRTLIETMQQVANSHPNANVAQVALNYCRAKGTIPIPGARNLRQIESNLGCLDWTMSSDEVRLLDQSSMGLSYINPDASPFPKRDKDTGLVMFDS